MRMKKGLLIAPEFPADSFWSFKYVMEYIRRKAPFPPLGLLTFAALMPQDEWEFELVDLNVERLSSQKLRKKIQDSDAVFTGAMNVQRDSLVDLLKGPAQGTDTPWVLGGPLASTYRSSIMNPRNEVDAVLHQGLDYLVWGEASPWIAELNRRLEEAPKHSDESPFLFIPERVLNAPEASRKYLQDRSIFEPFDGLPSPRWDLIEVGHYRALMLQTTAGCRFRCNFCDIIQFNGGFPRAKGGSDVTRELQAIYDTGFRGGVFTVDDNFVSEPKAMEEILDAMTEFQRQHDYPFEFFTQASIDLGKESLAYLVPLMQQAGFATVFLGIENPDPAALRQMNKIQNIKTAPKDTISLLQKHGIEVQAGFIFGADTDTPQTADTIVDFVEKNGVFSAMTGTLTPLPHTPLYVELKEQGRLLEADLACNNVDDTVQFKPVMGLDNMQNGFLHILESLFSPQAMYGRAERLIGRLDAHIFRNSHLDVNHASAALRSFARQSLSGVWTQEQRSYFHLLKRAAQLDRQFLRDIRTEARNLGSYWDKVGTAAKSYIELDGQDAKRFAEMLSYAQDALVRYRPDMGLTEVQDFVQRVREAVAQGVLPRAEAQSVYEAAREYLQTKRALFRFPGSHLVKAFELSIIGIHYGTVVEHVLTKMRSGDALTLSTEPMSTRPL
ncbi:MAG: DUF4070 domain-containing protein [Desulfurellaceae bacterium]|nr:DUF4070 domain-containing protein [Desulfurellaceae bacterium]